MRFLLLLLVLQQPVSASVSVGPVDEDSQKVVYDTTYIVKINPRLPDYAFHFRCLSTSFWGPPTMSLVVFRTPFDPAHLDTVQVIEEARLVDGMLSADDAIQFSDMNFDGNCDLLFLYNVGNNTVNMDYEVWLFNTKTGAFDLNQQFTDILGCNPEIDSAEHCITTSGFLGCVGNCWSTETYYVERDSLTLIAKSEQHLADEVSSSDGSPLYRRTKGRLIEGKWVVEFDKTGTFEELSKDD